MTTNDDLIRRARAGDRQATETLIAQHDRYVFGLALLTLGNRTEAQDVAQEAMIKALKGLTQYEGRAGFRTWLYRITLNACRDAQRRRARQRETRLDRVDWPALQAGLLHNELARERGRAIWQAVQTLDSPVRETVILRYYLDLSCGEIGQITDAPVNTVYWRLHQARKQLEPILLAQDLLAEEIGARTR